MQRSKLQLKNQNWSTKKLEDVCNIVYGYAFKASAFNETGKGLPVIRIGDVDKNKTNKFFDGKYDERYIVKKGDILLGLSGSFKAFRWEGDTALLNQRVATLRNFENGIVESFVFYQMPRLFVQFEKTITQLSVKNILTKHLENLKIFYPPFKIQKQIVERLDAIKKAQELNDKQIALADELFQALLHKELQPRKNWKMKKLEEVLEYEQPTNYIVHSVDYKDEYSTPVLTAGKSFILGYTNERTGIFPKEKLPVIIFDDFTTASKFVGFPFKVKSSAMKILHTKKGKANIKFLFYTMQKIKFVSNQHKRFWISEYSKIKIPLPPIETQQKIVEKLSAVQEYKKKLLKQKQKLQELFESVLSKSFKEKL